MDPEEKPKKLPFLQRHYGRLKEQLGPGPTAALDTALFVASVTYLSSFVNAALPFPEPFALAWALPSPTVALILLLFALSASLGRRPYSFVLTLVVILVLLPMRLFRWADLGAQSFLGRHVAGTDAASFQDLLIFLNDLTSFTALATTLFGVVIAVGLGLFVAKQALAGCFNYLRYRKFRIGAVGAIVLLGAVSLLVPSAEGHMGVFAEPHGLRLVNALGEAIGDAPDAEAKRAEITERAARLDRVATLDVGERDVLVLVLASYGADVFEESHGSALGADLRAFEAALREAGYHIRSHQLQSPVRGAQSELAHATLVTGVAASAPAHLDLLRELMPTTLATVFGRSGYTTLHVMPGIDREGPLEPFRFYGLATTYRSWELGYQGRAYGWIPVPDQYTLDIIHRRELEVATRPVFAQIELIGTRPVWAEQAPYVEDWDTLGDGALFDPLQPTAYPVSGLMLDGAVPAYQHALRHTLRVLQHYLTVESLRPAPPSRNRRARRRPPPLYVLVGDHPPLAPLRVVDHARVPIHVVSRDIGVLAPFEARGYIDGLGPTSESPILMEDFAQHFAADFGAPAAAP